MANISNIQCPWKNFYKQAIRCMNSLHIEACKPQMKVAKFIYAMRHNFASPTMNLTKESKKSTKQSQGSRRSTKQSKMMVQDTNNSTKGRTSNSDTDETDSAYNTESESNHTAHLPRPPCSPRPTRHHLQPRFNKSQQLMNTTYIKETKPSHNPVTKHTKSIKTDLQKPSTST